MNHKGNRGEWSELYAFLKILCEKELHAADASLNQIPDKLYPVFKIIRGRPSEESLSYNIKENPEQVLILKNEKVIREIEIGNISNALPELVREIRSPTDKSKGSFGIEMAEPLMNELQCKSVSGKSGDKTDITLTIFDMHTGIESEVGFSIKSKLGAAPSLLNAGATNFIYKVELPEVIDVNLVKALCEDIQSTGQIKNRVKEIKNAGGIFRFNGLSSENFKDNLLKMDSKMPEIIAGMLLLYFLGEATSIRDLVTAISSSEDLTESMGFSPDQELLEIKLKHLLLSSALGMQPDTPWNGEFEANGGFIIVRKDGELACYHLYDFQQLREYLFENTKLETPQIGKLKYGQLEKLEDGSYQLKLNLQIRFRS